MKRIGFLMLALLPLIACQKEEKITYFPVSAENKAFYNYQKGSYWIMEDATTQVRDSFAVVDLISSSTNYSSYGQIKEQLVIVIKDYPLLKSADPATWMIVLRDENPAELLFQSADSQLRVSYPYLKSPPQNPTQTSYEQGGRNFENVYETNQLSISYSNPLMPDTMSVSAVFNKEAGLIRLKTSINPDYHYDWQVVESRIVR